MWKAWTLVLCVGTGGCLVPASMVEAYLDRDADGERASGIGGTDCDDEDPRVGQRAVEVCGNGIDDDCDGVEDEDGVGASTFFTDADDDGFGDPEQPVLACAVREGLSVQAGDCNDASRTTSPRAPEDCGDGRDNDCDGETDEQDSAPRWWWDGDDDGYGTDLVSVQACAMPEGYVDVPGDCDDGDNGRYPRAPEVPYDGVDQDCAGDDDFDLDGDGWRVQPGTEVHPILDATYPHGTTLDCDDLDAVVYYGAPDDPYDGRDADCRGDDDFDVDGDGHRSANHGGDDCDDTNASAHPGRGETVYDGIDQDCDPSNDDDADGDGHGASFRGGDDCDDQEPDAWASCATCVDDDLDGYRTGCDRYGSRAQDCDDSDPRAWVSCATCGDGDGDGRWGRCDDAVGLLPDCDDDDATVWNRCGTCIDNDGDGVRGRCDVAGQVDCDDTLSSAWVSCATCEDEDEDGYGVGTCDAPVTDCDDADPNGTITCAPCVDEDGDFSYVGCDRYDSVLWDCDDSDPERGGATAEVLEDGIDQDCDGDDLTVDEEHGVFVSATTGEDEPGCGTRAYPCETIGWASVNWPQSTIFVASGTYDEAPVVQGHVLGGFDSNWTRRPGERAVIAGEVRPNGRMVVLDAIEIVAPASSFVSVSGSAIALHLVDTVIAPRPRSEFCELVVATFGLLSIRRTEMAASCGGEAKAVFAVPLRGRSSTAVVLVDDVTIDLSADSTVVFDVTSRLLGISRVSLDTRSSAGAVGVRWFGGVGGSLRVVRSAISVASGAIGSAVIVGGAVDVELLQSTFDVSALDAFVVTDRAASIVGSLENSAARAISSTGTAAVIMKDEDYPVGSGDWKIVHATLVARGPVRSSAIAGVPAVVVQNALIDADNMLDRVEDAEAYSTAYESGCLFAVDGVCQAMGSSDLPTCGPPCDGIAAVSMISDDVGFDGGVSGVWWIPPSTSAAIDAADPAWLAWPIDLDLAGGARPLGAGPDCGAVELR